MRVSHATLLISLILCQSAFAQDNSAEDAKRQEQEAQRAMMEQLLSGKMQVEQDDTPFEPLGFTGSYTMEVHSYKKGVEEKNSPTTMEYYFDDEHLAMILRDKENSSSAPRMIMDLKKKQYIMLMEDKGKKTGIIMPMMTVNFDEIDKVPSNDELKFERTGATKTIEGRVCHQYKGTNENGQWESWIDESAKVDMTKISRALARGKKMDSWQNSPMKGLLMETFYTDNNGKDSMRMYTKDVELGSVDGSIFSQAGYEMQDLTNMPGMNGIGK